MIKIEDIVYYTPLEALEVVKTKYSTPIKQSTFYWNIEKRILKSTQINDKSYIAEKDLEKFSEYMNLPRHKRRVIKYDEAKVLAFANHKGGVGKTVSVHNVSAALARKRHNVLMIDFDPQANLSLSAGINFAESNTIDDLILEKCSIDEATYDISNFLHIIPSYKTLSLFERKPQQYRLNYSKLSELILAMKPYYDFIIFDAPPHLSLLTTSVIMTSDYVYIPFQPDSFSYEGLETFLEYTREENPDIAISGIFLTRYQSNRALDKAITEAVQEKYSEIFLRTAIRENISIKEANTLKMDIFSHKPTSHGAIDYRKLTDDILNTLPEG